MGKIRDILFPVNNGNPKALPQNQKPLSNWQSQSDAAHSFFAGTYTYINQTGNLPTAGAEAFAFSQQMLPLLDWKGSGDLVQKNMQINSRQLYVTQSVVPTGIAGIGAGQTYAGNLLNLDLNG